MKKLKLFFACLLMAVLSIGQVLAGETTYTMKTSGSGTAVEDNWTANTSASFNSSGAYWSCSATTNTFTITSGSGITGTITKVQVTGKRNKNKSYSIDVTVGGSALGSTFNGSGNANYDTEDTFSSSTGLTGTIVVSVSAAGGSSSSDKGSFWITSVTVTTEDGGGEEPTQVATPSFSLAEGSYEGTQSVTITCATEGATIYYTTDGGTPSSSSTEYEDAISVSATQTIKAIAIKDGLDNSEVAEATYTITEGPDVTLDLLDGKWGFPTDNTTELTTYTNSVTGYAVKCFAATAYKVSGTSYFIIGKSGSYIELPTFASPVEKIIVTKGGGSSPSGSVVFNIFDGDDAVSTAVTGCGSDQTFEIENPEAGKTYTLKVTSAHNLQIAKIKIYYGAAPAVNKPTISGDEAFVTSTSVSMSCTTTGAAIYYTLDGSDPQLGGATLYEGSFSLTESGTVNARAKLGDDWSGMVSKTFTKVTALSTMAEVQAAATTTTDQPINVAISNWVVTAVSGGQAWIADADNAKGILLYKSGHGFEAGKKINGTVIGTKIKLYNLFPELTSLLASEVTVTDAEAVSPRSVTIPTLISNHPAEQGTIVKLDNVTYTSSMLSDGVNTIAADNKFFSSLALVEGTTYNITGVVTYYKNGDDAVVKIAPRSAADVEAQTPVVTPTAANLAALKAAARGTYILTLENAVVTYVNGKNAFIEDATGGALIFIQDHGFTAGDCLNGDYQVVTTDYQGKFEITAIEPQAGAATTTAAIPLTTVSIATLNASFSSYESRRVKIVGANVTDAIKNSDRNGAINDGAALAVYAAVASTITLNADDNVDIIGYPGFHNTDQQLNVWRQEDITVNVKEDPELAYNPAVVNVLLSDLASFTPAVLEYATGFDGLAAITYESSDPSIATVGETTGVVEVVATAEGSATITASFAGNATYKIDQASYTINVSATIDTRHVANSPATFTTTNGNLDPADITYASYQGGASTAPAIYNDGIRLYQIGGSNDFGGFVTITAKTGCTIDEVQITTTSKYATTVAYSVDGNENLLKSESVAASSSYTTGTGLNVSSVNILNLGTGSDGRLEIASIKVYYTGEAATIDHYELGGTYQTAFMQDEEFNHTGLIVYAVYDALGENKVDITSMCTFSEPDMSTTGEKTIEITYNEAVVISYTINVAADSRKVADSPATFTTVSGDMTPNDITFASYQGGASNPPANYNNGIRLYQAPSTDAIGGFITLKAKKGCTIDQVKITTTNSYATTVAYSVDGNVNLLGSESVAKSSDYSTPSGLNVESVNIVNKGTGSNGRLEIASIKVWYTGDALAVDHYILGGTYETVFEQYGTFSYEGLTVTAAYDAGETITEAVTGFMVEADLSTAGPAKANVMLNNVKIAEYDITVTASAKEDPALAYTPNTLTITKGDDWTAPVFSNEFGVSPISFVSDKPAIAAVDENGVITLEGGTGTAVITASFAGNDDYLASEATYTITVNEPAEDLSGTWVVATSVAAGDRIIIADVAELGEVKTMGGQNSNNRAAVASTVDELGVLTPAAGTKTFLVVDVENGEVALQALNGNYLYAASTSSNHLKETSDITNVNAKWTITIENGVATIKAEHEGHTSRNWMRYNSDNNIFSCYGSGQNDIVIYKKGTPTPVYETVREGLTPNHYYTICYPKAMTDIQGATLWSFVGKDANFAYIEQETASTIEAGKPYIMYATASTVTAVLGDETNAPGANGAIHGTFSDLVQEQLDNFATVAGNDLYLVIGDELRRATGTGTGSNTLPAQRAFVVLGDIPAAPAQMPAHVRSMPLHKDATQGFENLDASEKPLKVMIDGTLYILRGEKVYDATGRLVK